MARTRNDGKSELIRQALEDRVVKEIKVLGPASKAAVSSLFVKLYSRKELLDYAKLETKNESPKEGIPLALPNNFHLLAKTTIYEKAKELLGALESEHGQELVILGRRYGGAGLVFKDYRAYDPKVAKSLIKKGNHTNFISRSFLEERITGLMNDIYLVSGGRIWGPKPGKKASNY